jgi:tRNA threonylcarbamoyladenosine biosynthesis protein TsaE
MMTLFLPDPAATDALGAGKSALARAMLRALAGDPALEVPSPTYTLVQTYDTPLGTVAHFDLWRLDGEAGVQELGWDESALALVEWPDRLGSLRPADALTVSLSPEGHGRRAVLTGWEGRL